MSVMEEAREMWRERESKKREVVEKRVKELQQISLEWMKRVAVLDQDDSKNGKFVSDSGRDLR